LRDVRQRGADKAVAAYRDQGAQTLGHICIGENGYAKEVETATMISYSLLSMICSFDSACYATIKICYTTTIVMCS